MSDKPMQEEEQSINSTEEEETPTEDSEVEEEGGETEEELAALRAKVEELEKAKAQLTARAKDAEAKAKAKRNDLKTPDTPSSEEIDERVLRSQGHSTEDIDDLKRVARFNETDLLSALSDPMYLALKEKREQAERDKEASLGASRSSGKAKPKKDFSTPGLTPDDHKNLWKQTLK